MNSNFTDYILSRTIVILTLLNGTNILYTIYDAHYSESISNDKLNETDVAFLAVYCFPTAGFYLAALIVLCYLAANMTPNEYYQFRADLLIVSWFNVIIFKRNPDEGRHNIVNDCCDRISRNTVINMMNFILVFIVTAILLCFLPIMAISLLWDKSKSLQYIGFVIQTMTVTINILFHLFCFNYGYYSLIILLFGLFHLYLGIAYYGMYYKLHATKLSWIIFETFTAFTVLSITFMVKYSDKTLYVLSIICFANYVFPNIPFFKLYLYKYYKELQSNGMWKFLMIYDALSLEHDNDSSYNSLDNTDESNVSILDVYDKCYFLLHQQRFHYERKRTMTRESSEFSILLPSSNEMNGLKHEVNSIQCLRMQYNYLKCNTENKIAIINGLNPKRKTVITVNITLYIYILSSLIAFLYPIFWFFYEWIYLNTFSASNYIKIGNNTKAEYSFLWIMNLLYLIVAIYWLIVVLIFLQTKSNVIKGMITEKSASIFVMSLKGCYDGDILQARTMYNLSPITLTVMKSTCFQLEIALIVLSYLY